MDLHAKPFRCFVAVAELGTFSRAAVSLNMSQPSLSAQIKELERRLGFNLFIRTSRKVELSAEGLLFLGNARRIIMESDWLRQAAQDISTNQLRIGAAHHTGAIRDRQELIDRFIVAHPPIALRVIGRRHSQIAADLDRQTVDLALTIELRGEDGERSAVEQGTKDFERIILRERRVELLLTEDDPLAREQRIPVGGLKKREVCIVDRNHGITLAEGLARKLERAGAILKHPPEGDAASTMRHGALLGVPAINLGWFSKPDLPWLKPLVSRPAEELQVVTALVLLRSRHAQRPAAMTFWQHAQAFKDT
ncbi:LysR family transcriptional regulator [Novosphingobium colocasiae]|uniref:HTH lysR-type domain-containing protein n=1 Tax=Novosphingobium colocasiae TaxID=1256513 RepID=A0A918PPD9_9SPHN|nr:LysR family transcriptional regulator [Novosphingobium colocasiae]GGZ16521.1 hypothetical protein GCM10011614_34110 [Novosphingobium colocasiae]